MGKVNKKRSLAAKKGWKTRKANLAFEKRSKAAKKGWKTRKAEPKKKKKIPPPPPPKGSGVEYVIHFSYENKRSGIQFQIHITGPSDATDNEAIAVAIAIVLEVRKIEGWKFILITYSHPPSPRIHTWDEALRPLYEKVREGGVRTVQKRIKI